MNQKAGWILLFLLTAFIYPSLSQDTDKTDLSNAEIKFPKIIIRGIEKEIKFLFPEKFSETLLVELNSKPVELKVVNGVGIISYSFNKKEIISLQSGTTKFEKEVNPVPLWLSILPPLIAIMMALLFREVISSLLIGIFIGAAVIHFYSDCITGIFSGFLAVIDTYIIQSLENWDHLSVIMFSMMIGAMVTVISKNGGMQGVVNKISAFAKTAKSGQLATYLLGIVIFFDDYANTLVVGNTMRPVTDRLRISREKLSYLVDSTAAPIASIAFVTTWIGAQLGYIKDSVSAIDGLDESAYSIFINSLQFAFYPIFTLAFMLILIMKSKDFGPMYKAEIRARDNEDSDKEESGKIEVNEELAALEAVKGTKPKGYNAVIPVLIVIFGTITGLLYTGWDAEVWDSAGISYARKVSIIIGNANSYQALLWSSMCGLASAIILTISQRIMTLSSTMESMIKGFKTMLTAVLILVLAWSLALVTQDMHTADFITGLLMSVDLSPVLLPAITFILAAVVAFSTGSSWGTMAILYPLMLPASWLLCVENGLSPEMTHIIFYNVVSTVLAGSVLGDHCSPISDTTILSSLASSCNHIEHVRTQLPYALTVGGVSILIGTIPAAMGISSIITFPIGILILFLIVQFFGKIVKEKVLIPVFK